MTDNEKRKDYLFRCVLWNGKYQLFYADIPYYTDSRKKINEGTQKGGIKGDDTKSEEDDENSMDEKFKQLIKQN